MRRIKLSQGKFATVDDRDFEKISAHRWYAHRKENGLFYAVRHSTASDGRPSLVRMHQEVLGCKQVDHVNPKQTLNNRRKNLRRSTASSNGMNRGKQKNNSTGIKGVNKYRNGRYRASIGVRGRQIHLGYFRLKRQAKEAYQKAALKYHKRFRRF